jgi:YbbR domain-containing protein
MIRVSLRGEKNSIDPIMDDDIETYLDLSKYTEEGVQRVPVQFRKLGTALGVDPLEIKVDPVEITLELDHRISRYVSLSPNIQGYPEQGYELSSSTITPNQVVVDGPMRIMSGISELSTDVIELGGRSEDFTATVRIMNPDPLLVIRGDGFAEFRGLVKKIINSRNFDNLPITIRDLDSRFTAEIAQLSFGMRLEGNRYELETYVPEQGALYLDCSAITGPGTWDLPVQAEILPAFTLIQAEPQTVTVIVREAPAGTED